MSTENLKLCSGCNSMFEPYRDYQKYCSTKCRLKITGGKVYPSYYEKKRSEIKNCKHCDKEFLTNNDKKVFCCEDCRIKYYENRKTEKEERFCLVCDASFMTSHWSKRYCSPDCRETARRQRLEIS
jgi:hypothetical protein